MKKEDVKKEDPNTGGGQCAKDSDCGTGEVCVNGRCVQDIAPPPPAKDENPK